MLLNVKVCGKDITVNELTESDLELGKFCSLGLAAIDKTFFAGTLEAALQKTAKPIKLVQCLKRHSRQSVTIMHTEGAEQGTLLLVQLDTFHWKHAYDSK